MAIDFFLFNFNCILTILDCHDYQTWLMWHSGKWPLARNPDISWLHRHTSLKLFLAVALAQWTTGPINQKNLLIYVIDARDTSLLVSRFESETQLLLKLLFECDCWWRGIRVTQRVFFWVVSFPEFYSIKTLNDPLSSLPFHVISFFQRLE